MDALEIQSSYNLEIRIVASNCHGRWYELSKNVDADRTSLGDLVDEIVDKNPHGYGEIVKVFYFDLDRKVNIEVGTDQDLLALFAKHYVSKCYLMTFAYYRPASGPPYILDWDFGSSEKFVEPPFTPSIPGPSFAEPSHSTHTQNGDDEILANPNPMNEHVGVDDECLYIDLGPKHPQTLQILQLAIKTGKRIVLMMNSALIQIRVLVMSLMMKWLQIEALILCLMFIMTRRTLPCL
jgi:hypothetical protein